MYYIAVRATRDDMEDVTHLAGEIETWHEEYEDIVDSVADVVADREVCERASSGYIRLVDIDYGDDYFAYMTDRGNNGPWQPTAFKTREEAEKELEECADRYFIVEV